MKTIVGAVVSLGILAGGVWASLKFLGVSGSVVFSMVIGIFAWLTNQAVEQTKERRHRLAVEKREQYLEFMDFINETFPLGGEGAKLRTNPDRVRQLRQWSLHLTLIGSDEVVTAWNDARLSDANPKGEAANVLLLWGKLWLAMRKDCGHHDTKLEPPDMLASIVDDVEKFRALWKEQDQQAS